MTRRILITGGAGYLGYKVARRYLDTTDEPLLLWLRARDEAEFDDKRALCRRVFPERGNRIAYAYGTLDDDEPYRRVDPRDVKAMVHPAANTRFDIDEDTALAINIEGTRKTVEFAATCPHLESFTHFSTIYSSGLVAGSVPEAPIVPERFANHYERSKWESEEIVRAQGELPWRILRVATILADDDDGRVLQYNIAHKVMRLMYLGLLPIFPGVKEMPIYFVTGDFVADATLALAARAPVHACFNVCHAADRSLGLDDWLQRSYDHFQGDSRFASRRVMRPMMTDLPAFRSLAASVNAFSRDLALRAVVTLVRPFDEQMFVVKKMQNGGLREYAPDHEGPDPRELLARVCEFLCRTQWGIEAVPDDFPPRVWEA